MGVSPRCWAGIRLCPVFADTLILKHVKSLSNFLRKSDVPPSGGEVAGGKSAVCRPAWADEIRGALSLILAAAGRPADAQHVSDFLAFSAPRNIDPAQMWIAERDGLIVWAVLPIFSPGRTMLLFAPSDAPGAETIGPACALIDAICAHYALQDVQLAQVLLEPSDDAGRRLFESREFARMAELIYLHAAVRRTAAMPRPPEGFFLETYSPANHPLFEQAILASYQKSLDCPGLNGVRDIGDIVAGHKASGKFDPRYWFVLCEKEAPQAEARPRGVLLLSRLHQAEGAELVYLGLAPEARGRSLGEWLMRHAFATTAAMGLPRLSLAVDSMNVPALKLYYRFGMARMGSKIAMMRKLAIPQ